MHRNYTLICSPINTSERKDSDVINACNFAKKEESKDDHLQFNFDIWNDDAVNEERSIFNIRYSPQPRRIDKNQAKIRHDFRIPFPILTNSFKSQCSNSESNQATTCQASSNTMQNIKSTRMFSTGDNSKVDESDLSAYNKNYCIKTETKEYMNNIMRNDRFEIESFNEFENNIKSKGLKLLSIIVFDIVSEKVTTTYKEVADLILKDTICSFISNIDKKKELTKEEQNVKRRVYDVLNVLISSNAFIKKGKIVSKNNFDVKCMIRNQRAQINSMYSKLVY